MNTFVANLQASRKTMASAEDYESVMGGSLKLKGVNLRLPKGLKKKKKKKKKKDK